MNKLDDLFREGLHDHSIAPSPRVWEKVEASLSKKNDMIAWRWAAALVVAGLFIGLWWARREKPALAVSTPEPLPAKKEINTPEILPRTESVKQSPARSRTSRKKTVTKPETLETLSVVVDDLPIETAHPVIEATAELPAREVQKQKNRGIVLTFTLADPAVKPEEKAIAEETVVASLHEEVAPVQDQSSLKRMMRIARKVKTSDPLGELRVMKEDLFALELKKKSAQNKIQQ